MLSLENVEVDLLGSSILRKVSLSVDKGQIVGLIGRNGSGRSVTLKSIMGLLPVRGGRINFDGKDIANRAPHQIARDGIAYVPEERIIFPELSVDENLRLALLALRRKIVVDNLSQIYSFFPMLAAIKGRSGRVLSGGEQQMLAIARGLITNPKLMLLDEPTKGLAPAIVKDVKNILAQLSKRGISLLVVDQNPDFLRDLASFYYVINRGEIQFKGDYEALNNNEELVRRSLGYIYKS